MNGMANNKGFSLIEVLVAIVIFGTMLTVFAGVFVGSIQSQQNVLASQSLIDSVSYNLEYMSRALRMAKKQLLDGIECLSSNGLNYELTRGGKGLKFIKFDHATQQDVCQEFFWNEEEGRLYEWKDDEWKDGEEFPLTPASLQVVSFEIGGDHTWGQDDLIQPKVILFLEIETREHKPADRPSITIQTTVSQRNLNVQY